MITFLEISGQTDEIRIEFVVFHTVWDNEFYVGINLFDGVILIIVNFSFDGSEVHRLFDNVEVIGNVEPLNVDWFSEGQGYDVFLKAWDHFASQKHVIFVGHFQTFNGKFLPVTPAAHQAHVVFVKGLRQLFSHWEIVVW